MSSHAFLLQFERERCLVRDDAQTKLLPCDPFDSNLPPSQTLVSNDVSRDRELGISTSLSNEIICWVTRKSHLILGGRSYLLPFRLVKCWVAWCRVLLTWQGH